LEELLDTVLEVVVVGVVGEFVGVADWDVELGGTFPFPGLARQDHHELSQML